MSRESPALEQLIAAVEFEADDGDLAEEDARQVRSAGSDFFIDEEPVPPGLLLAGEGRLATPADDAPIIDRDDEVPESIWVQEGAPLVQRAVASAVDLALVAGVLGLFVLGALLALRQSGYEPELLLEPAARKAVGLPFSLLAVLVSLAYFAFFHLVVGRTPGKRLAGIEIRTRDGGPLTFGRVLLRFVAVLVALAPAGAGLAWALFEPRRRGLADLVSGTVLARRRQE